MANLGSNFSRSFMNCVNFLQSQKNALPYYVQTRSKTLQIPYHGAKNYWPKWTMMKDQRKRMTLKEYGPYKLRINAIRKCTMLPPELREQADIEIARIPVDAAMMRIVPRCIVTSKPRGNVYKWKLGRHLFRSLADYNKLAGIIRARW